ncbi:DUF2785 domain-containing protein [Lysinibacillus sp. BW-2-10]|uniref:DUF2785 domain-containing protein n=1 Tax=Lysinibacillus sp. BW-2-10 TaxID=2590030 RepID=UPI00117D864D|nr:DUF2785 domain-containing protein [Lysinibacillus sp. BW-2-10]TSI05257.1 DUF2785 domain-containing protein [Lysinibacillus sp. BW-2-10]
MKTTLENILNMNVEERQLYLNQNGDALIQNMLLHIGTPEDELRDKLNYRLFIELLSQQQFTQTQMKTMTTTLINSDFLFSSINENESDHVFTRSFSALWLTGLLHADRQLQFLSKEQALDVLTSGSRYMSREKDVRGFVAEKGWALAITHGADLATAIISHPAFEIRLAPTLLQGVKDSFWKGSVYTNDEDERLAAIIMKLIEKDYPVEILIEWVEQVFDKLQFYLMEVGYTPHYFVARTNTLNFMKTLYFTLKFSQKAPELKGVVSLLIANWMKQS